MIVLGLLLLFWGYCNVNAGIMSDGLSLSVRNAARAVGDRMSEEEMRRVFDMPDQVQDRRVWFEGYCGLFWAREIRWSAGMNAFGSAGLGIVICAWGIAEGICRKRKNPPSP